MHIVATVNNLLDYSGKEWDMPTLLWVLHESDAANILQMLLVGWAEMICWHGTLWRMEYSWYYRPIIWKWRPSPCKHARQRVLLWLLCTPTGRNFGARRSMGKQKYTCGGCWRMPWPWELSCKPLYKTSNFLFGMWRLGRIGAPQILEMPLCQGLLGVCA